MAPKPYVRAISPTTWYLSSRGEMLHMLHEVTSIFIGIYALILLWGLGSLAQGPQAYQAFLSGLSSPPSRSCHWVALIIRSIHAHAGF